VGAIFFSTNAVNDSPYFVRKSKKRAYHTGAARPCEVSEMALPLRRCVTIVVMGVLTLGPAQAVKLHASKRHNSRDIGGDPGKLMIGDSKDNWFPIGETLWEQKMEKNSPVAFVKEAKSAGMKFST
jgi:hypothetical protein